MKSFTLMRYKMKQRIKVNLHGMSVVLFGWRPTHQNHWTNKLNYLIRFCYLKSWVWMDFFFKVMMS